MDDELRRDEPDTISEKDTSDVRRDDLGAEDLADRGRYRGGMPIREPDDRVNEDQ